MANDTTSGGPAFERKLSEQTAATAFQLVWGWVKGLKDRAWDEVAVRKATAAYADSYRERHGAIHVLGMSKPVPLHDIYTAVRVVPRDYLGAFTRPDEMEKSFKDAGRQHRAFHTDRVEDGVTVANREPFLNLLGAPGAGKSTFLRRLGQEAMLARKPTERIDTNDAKLDSRYEHARLPVYLELRLFRTKGIDLPARIAEEFSNCGFPDSPRFVAAALQAGRLLVLLDGLDEVPGDKLGDAIDHIRAFVDQHAKAGNRFVTSCRTAHYKNEFPRFTDLVVADFSDKQIETFAGNWFTGLHQRQAETAKRFVEVLNDPANTAARELARTPLLLTFLCLTFANGQDLPPTRATLYRRALDLLLREWAASKRVHDEPVYRELNADLELDMLAEFAEKLFRDDRFFFNRETVTAHIHAFMSRELSAPKSLDAGKILEAIEVQQGLIVRRAQDTYSFSHLTIQEYLTAKKIWEDGEYSWTPVVNEHLHEDRWVVVFELMAGMGKADNLLRAMAVINSRSVGSQIAAGTGLPHFLTWIVQQQSAHHTEAASRVVGRCILLALARAFALARDPARDFARDFALDLAIDLAFALARDRDFARDFARNIDIARDHARDTIGSLLGVITRHHISEVTLADLERCPPVTYRVEGYLAGVRLLLRCKAAAYRLSTDTWNEVCDSILTPPTS